MVALWGSGWSRYDAVMRVTLEIDDDVMEAARELARLKRQGLGRVVTDLVRRGLMRSEEPLQVEEFGVPVWRHGPGAVRVTSELVRGLLEGEGTALG